MRCASSSPLKGDDRFVLPGAKSHYSPDRAFDTQHIRLEIDLNIPGKRFRGRALTQLRAFREGVSEIVFDAVHFKVLGVTVPRKRFTFQYKDPRLSVKLSQPLKANQRVEVIVDYEVIRPRLGMYFIGPDAAEPRKEVQVWTQGEDEYARYWFPCHDAPQQRTTTELIAKVPRDMTAISNGRLFKKTISGSRAVFHWKQDIPHATYLVTLAVGRFTEIKDRWRGKPVTYYVPKGREEDGRRAFGKTPKMLEFFSSKIGVPYAYAKYAQVAALDFIYGGMENTSATTQTAMTLHDARAHLDFKSEGLVAHELAHQWFGDLLTCKDWSHAWLNESFATYFDALFQEHALGADEFAYQMYENAQAYLEEDRSHYRRPIVTQTYEQPSDLFDRHLYEKGSCVLHMLRDELGDADFWRSIRTYVSENKGKVVETVDWIDAIHRTTGRNPRHFFDQWVFNSGHPEYKVRFWWEPRTKECVVRVVQTQSDAAFDGTVVFSFTVKGKETRERKGITQKSNLFRFKLAAEPELFRFDPEHKILKKLDLVKPEWMWIEQLMKDSHVIGRVDAAKALGKRATAAAIQALHRKLLKESFWGASAAIADALGSAGGCRAREALLDGLHRVRHPKVRRAIYANLAKFHEPIVAREIAHFHDSEASYFVEAEAVKALAKVSPLDAARVVERQLKRDSWNDIFRSSAVHALGSLQSADLEARLWSLASPRYRPQVRVTALQHLETVSSAAILQPRLLSLLKDPQFRVRSQAVRMLKNVGDERAVPALKKIREGDEDGRLKRAAHEAIFQINRGIEEKKS